MTVDDDPFDFVLAEELDRQAVVDRAALARVKYGWQRVPSVLEDVGSGRLQLRLGKGYRSWAERQRWSLDDKLPAVFKELEDRAAAAAAVRARRDAQRQQRRAAWEQAVDDAKQAFIDNLNRERLGKQIADAARAEAVRAYCDRLDTLATGCRDDDQADRIRRWARWARAEADASDPLAHPEQLRHATPESVQPHDLTPFMPNGMNPWRPPD